MNKLSLVCKHLVEDNSVSEEKYFSILIVSTSQFPQ